MMRILYLGLSTQGLEMKGEVTHFPVIRIVPFPVPPLNEECSHAIYTSQTTVQLLAEAGRLPRIPSLAVGPATALLLSKHHIPVQTATTYTAEGVVDLLDTLQPSRVFYPHSALARPVIQDHLRERGIPFIDLPLYTTESHTTSSPPDLNNFDVVVFTSPSTVKGCLDAFGMLPKKTQCYPIGPVTQRSLDVAFDSIPC